MCERWLKNQKIRIIHIETTPDVYPLYINYGYFEILLNDPDNPEPDSQHVSIGKVLNR